MNWDAIGAIGEVLGAVAVVATLFYLAIQIRQNSRSVEQSVRALRLSAAEGTVEGFSRYRERISRSEGSALVAKGRQDYTKLSDAEQIQFDAIMGEYMFSYWALFLRREEGMYDAADWGAHMLALKDTLSWPGTAAWWRVRQSGFSPKVVAELQSRGL